MDDSASSPARKLKRWVDSPVATLPANADDIESISNSLEIATREVYLLEFKAQVDSFVFQKMQSLAVLPVCIYARLHPPSNPFCFAGGDEYAPLVSGKKSLAVFVESILLTAINEVFPGQLLNFLPGDYRRDLIRRLISHSRSLKSVTEGFAKHSGEHIQSRGSKSLVRQDPNDYPFEFREFVNRDGIDPGCCHNHFQTWHDFVATLGTKTECLMIECLAVCRLAVKSRLREIRNDTNQRASEAAGAALRIVARHELIPLAPKGTPGRKPSEESQDHADYANSLRAAPKPLTWGECAKAVNEKFKLNGSRKYTDERIRNLHRVKHGDKSQKNKRDK